MKSCQGKLIIDMVLAGPREEIFSHWIRLYAFASFVILTDRLLAGTISAFIPTFPFVIPGVDPSKNGLVMLAIVLTGVRFAYAHTKPEDSLLIKLLTSIGRTLFVSIFLMLIHFAFGIIVAIIVHSLYDVSMYMLSKWKKLL